MLLLCMEKPKMAKLKARIQSELGIQCHDPASNETVSIPTTQILISASVTWKFTRDEKVAERILVMEKNKTAKVMCDDELLKFLGEREHKLKCASCCPVNCKRQLPNEPSSEVPPSIESSLDVNKVATLSDCLLLQLLLGKPRCQINWQHIQSASDHFQVNSLQVQICSNKDCPYRTKERYCSSRSTVFFCCNWSVADEALARKVISIMKELELDYTEKTGLMLQ